MQLAFGKAFCAPSQPMWEGGKDNTKGLNKEVYMFMIIAIWFSRPPTSPF